MNARIDEHRLQKRYYAILAVFILCFTVLLGRLVVLQVVKHEEYLQKAKDNIENRTALKAERGIIYDRNMVPLAVNKTSYRIYISPRDIKNDVEAQKAAKGLSEILGLDEEKLFCDAKDKRVRDRTVKNNADEEICSKVREFITDQELLHCVHIEAGSTRYYPYGSLAANVIGFVGTDGGLTGIESRFDEYLRGSDGYYITQKNASGQSLPDSYDTYVKAQSGADIVLTIDIALQSLLENQLKQTYIDSKARERVCGAVIDPNSGEVLAMATYPAFDLNDPYTLSDYYLSKLALCGYAEGSDEYKKQKNDYLYEMWNNKAVSVLYEPGSTFKIITVSVALEEKVSTVGEHFFCTGSLKIDGYGTPIRCHKRGGHGSLTFAQALQKSCNPTMIKLANRIGNTTFMQYFKAFGYTGKTGIDLPGEAKGIFHDEKDFNNVELSVYSFGQTFKITPIMQLSAVSCVANGGTKVTPYTVKSITKGEDVLYTAPIRKGERVISEQTANTVSDILIEGVNGDGGAKNAGVLGYRIAAKTGTSQKRDIKDENLYVGSCVAYAVYDKASVAVIIAVDEPMCANYYGSTVAAPYVSAFLADALPYLGIEATLSESDEKKMNVKVPDTVGMSAVKAKAEIAKAGLKYEIVGSGETVIMQIPQSGQSVNKESGKVIIYTDGEISKYASVPSVEGMTATEAIAILINSGFNVRLEGATDYQNGVGATVIKQDIVKVEAEKGTVITLWLRYLDKKE